MITKHLNFLSLFLSATPFAYAETFNCRLNSPPFSWDLTSLPPANVTRRRHTPPTSTTDVVEIDLCHDLIPKEVSERDQCPAGTRACLRTWNRKDHHDDRITRVIPIMGDIPNLYNSLDTYTWHTSDVDNSRALSLSFNGAVWPPEHEGTVGVTQRLNITFWCSDTDSSPTITSYRAGVLRLEWNAKAACPTIAGERGKYPGGGDREGGGGSGRTGSGVGWFFLVLFLAILAYFGLGAYYNYTQYGASGWDLVPHRDFWRDVPYLLRDISSHLCSAIRPGGGRGGYTSV